MATLSASKVDAMTTTAAVQACAELRSFSWSLVLFDEAGQIILPAAAALATLCTSALYAGDPKQLAAVVKSADKRTQALLGRTAFGAFRRRARSVFLDEQSRMAPEICDAVSASFYEGRLRTCATSQADDVWRQDRECTFIDGYELPHLATTDGQEVRVWSKLYGGAIRYTLLIDHLLERLFVEERRRLKIIPNAFGERPVLSSSCSAP
jgi:hypothetical protein